MTAPRSANGTRMPALGAWLEDRTRVATRVTHPEPLVWRPARRGTRAAVVVTLVALVVLVLAAWATVAS